MVALYRLAEQTQAIAANVEDPAKKTFLSDAIFDEIKQRAKTVMKFYFLCKYILKVLNKFLWFGRKTFFFYFRKRIYHNK